uniref:Ig-like domain-containing protein n=1 Tax=Amphiprion percula TaxID=161767 RepID=A0A3P8TT91_AMPPE
MWPVAWILLLCWIFSDAVSVIYRRTGGEVVIPSGSAADLITAITWKHNEDIAVEWYGGEPAAYRHFNGCTVLDTLTGALNISRLTRDHSGIYTAEINNKVANKTEIRVISAVPKPTVSQLCSFGDGYCTLTCEGNTTDAEPVTYSWHTHDMRNYFESQQVGITKEDPNWFSCEMTNPISSETSEEFENPVLSSIRTFIISISVLGILLLLLIALMGWIFISHQSKFKKGAFYPVKVHRSETPESNHQTGKNNKRTDKKNTRLSRNGVATVPAVSVEETLDQTPQKSSVLLNTIRETAVLNISETSNPDKTSKKPNDEIEVSSKKEEETQALIHRSEAPESNDQTATTTSEALTSVAEKSNEAVTDSQDQKTSRNDLKTAASTETEESAEKSNGDETTRPLLDAQNRSISVCV